MEGAATLHPHRPAAQVLRVAPLPGVDAPLVDAHVHLAALPDASNRCIVSPRIRRSPFFRLLCLRLGLPQGDPEAANRKYVDALLGRLRASRHVQKAVVLGLDGVYDARGRLDPGATDFSVHNDYVLKVAREHPGELFAGVSINPQRADALEEVERCADAGAALVKVLPNTQDFDPADPRYRDYYRALARRGLPLLCHTGHEFTLTSRNQSFGDPARLRLALDEGVLVIAAHACSRGLFLFERFLPTFQELVRAYPRFFADVSALTIPNRCGMLLRLRRHPELQERLLFGTDYPVPVLALPVLGRVGFASLRQVLAASNPFDRQVEVCRSLGIRFGTLGLA